MEEPNVEAPIDAQLMEAVEIMDDALKRSDLLVPNLSPEQGPFGDSDSGCLIAGLLGNAGIVAECCEGISEDRMFEFQQIIDGSVLREMVTAQVGLEDVKLADMHQMVGFQLKLIGVFKWKLKVATKNHGQHRPTAREGRGQANTEFQHFSNHSLHEIFVPSSDNGMRATIAASSAIVITVLFSNIDAKNKKMKDWGKTKNMPTIAQRKIDMLFHNKYVARLQVRSFYSILFCAPCSVLRARFPWQTIFIDVHKSADANEDDEDSLQGLRSNASDTVDDHDWQLLIAEGTVEGHEALVRNVMQYGGTPLDDFMAGKYGPRKKYAEWLKQDESFLIGAQRTHASGDLVPRRPLSALHCAQGTLTAHTRSAAMAPT